MGRFWFGILLLAIFLGLGIWVNFCTDAVNQPISQALDEATELSLSGNLDEGISLARQAKEIWETHWHGIASIADHSPMDEIDGLFAQLEVYARAEQRTDFAAYCARLSKLVNAVGEAHSLNWWNLL